MSDEPYGAWMAKELDDMHGLPPEMQERADRLLDGLRHVAESFLKMEAELLLDWSHRREQGSPRFKGWKPPERKS